VNSRVFISYSRNDRHIVEPLVQLLRLRGDLVFFDIDSISPGQLWRDELETAIETAAWFVLFWCAHSSQSREVEREFRAALAKGKKVVPLLLDDTALPDRVAAFQGIDFTSIPGLHPPVCTAKALTTNASKVDHSTSSEFVAGGMQSSTQPTGDHGGLGKATKVIPARARPVASYAEFGIEGGTVGRSNEATLCLPDTSRRISRIHLKIIHNNGCFTVENRGLHPISHADKYERYVEVGAVVQIFDGDTIQLGDYLLSASIPPSPKPSLRLDVSVGVRGTLPVDRRSTPNRAAANYDPFGPLEPKKVSNVRSDSHGASAGPQAKSQPSPVDTDIDALLGLIPPRYQPPAEALAQAADKLLGLLLTNPN
jgi:hypothetical protein